VVCFIHALFFLLYCVFPLALLVYVSTITSEASPIQRVPNSTVPRARARRIISSILEIPSLFESIIVAYVCASIEHNLVAAYPCTFVKAYNMKSCFSMLSYSVYARLPSRGQWQRFGPGISQSIIVSIGLFDLWHFALHRRTYAYRHSCELACASALLFKTESISTC
jgi:hypothetical protein